MKHLLSILVILIPFILIAQEMELPKREFVPTEVLLRTILKIPFQLLKKLFG